LVSLNRPSQRFCQSQAETRPPAQAQSQTKGNEAPQCAKLGTRYLAALPVEMMDILRWHLANLPKEPMASSELLFPSDTGGFQSMPTLDKPFDSVVKAIGLKKQLPPKGMRRMYQDLARKANVPERVARNICGHATVAMQEH
jgi:integrase